MSQISKANNTSITHKNERMSNPVNELCQLCEHVRKRKPTQLPPLAMRVSGDLQAVGLKKVMLLHLLYHPHLDNCIVCW